MWLVGAGAAPPQWVVNQGLVLSAFRLEDPATRSGTSARREELHNDATELCAALLVALGMTVSDLTLIIALPLATLLQRSSGTRSCSARPAPTPRPGCSTPRLEPGRSRGGPRPAPRSPWPSSSRPRPVQADQRRLRPPGRRRGSRRSAA